MKRYLTTLHPETAVLLVVDVQERLLPAIHDGPAVVEAAARMTSAAGVLDVPVVLTEQYPQGLGRTVAAVRDCAGEVSPIEKLRFSACIDEVIGRLSALNRPNVIVVGIEAHVCVQQSVLDLLRLGYLPFVCADAIGSRRPLDRDTAIERMGRAGAVITTTESAIFEMTGQAGTELFKRVLKIVK